MAGSILSVAAAGAVAALPGVVQVGDQVLAAASCGLRETLWIDHYAATLYVTPGVAPDTALLDPRRAKALEVRLLDTRLMPRDIPRKYRRALDASLDAGKMARLRDAYRALRPGDVVRISYLPGAGTSLAVNGQVVAKAPAHRVVEAALFAWAGDKPLGQHLRAMLAKHPCPPITG